VVYIMAGKRRDKGKSHPIRPVRIGPPKWVRYSEDEVATLAAELARLGYTPSMIGVILRDQYGIPLVKSITGLKLTKILSKQGVSLPIPEDLLRLMAKAVNLRRHLNEHPKDYTSKRGLIETESKINALIKYYKRIGKLPHDFVYEPERARILVSQYLGVGTQMEVSSQSPTQRKETTEMSQAS
jgi:small subunit ribosomal protein S15